MIHRHANAPVQDGWFLLVVHGNHDVCHSNPPWAWQRVAEIANNGPNDCQGRGSHRVYGLQMSGHSKSESRHAAAAVWHLRIEASLSCKLLQMSSNEINRRPTAFNQRKWDGYGHSALRGLDTPCCIHFLRFEAFNTCQCSELKFLGV